VLHIPAIAKAAGVSINVEDFDRISRETPNLCKIIPAGPFEIADVDKAGGIPAVLNRLIAQIKDNPTVNGKTIKEIAVKGKVLDDDVIRKLDNPFFKEGGIAVLKGNIAHTAIIKQTAVDPSMMTHTGPAKVFYSEKDMLDAVVAKKIKEGDVVVLPFQGPAGAPGMPEMLTPTDVIKGAGYKRVALLTDGRFSGGTSGPNIGHIEMEAYNGGPIAAIRDGDIIEIDIPNRKLNARLTDKEIKARLKTVVPPKRTMSSLIEAYREKFIGKNCYGY
jgi:dihydroxy-acid dehydratase